MAAGFVSKRGYYFCATNCEINFLPPPRGIFYPAFVMPRPIGGVIKR